MREDMPGHRPGAAAAIDQAVPAALLPVPEGDIGLWQIMPPSVIDQVPYVGSYGYLAGLANVLPPMTTSAPLEECPGETDGVCLGHDRVAPFRLERVHPLERYDPMDDWIPPRPPDRPPVGVLPYGVIAGAVDKASAFTWPPCAHCGATAGGTHTSTCPFNGTGR